MMLKDYSYMTLSPRDFKHYHLLNFSIRPKESDRSQTFDMFRHVRFFRLRIEIQEPKLFLGREVM